MRKAAGGIRRCAMISGGNALEVSSKNEFLQELRLSLQGEISPEELEESIRYYEEYFTIKERQGISEEEVLEELGSPRLIARTIIDTKGRPGREAGPSAYREVHEEEADYRPVRTKVYLALAGIAVLAVILLVGYFVFKIVAFFFYFFWPVLLVIFLVRLFRRRY